MPNKYFFKAFGLWLSVLAIFVFLTLNKHSKSGYYNYHSEIWGDKAGYYIYLPSTFIYHFNPALLPDSIVQKTGNGFVPDTVNRKISTKYFCGIALMQLPFFMVTHLITPALGYPPDGFSPPYHRSIDVAAVFYLILGMFLLLKILKTRFDHQTGIWVIVMTVLGTNLFYYAIDETGMSHVYSFALFAAFLLLLQKTHYLKTAGLGLKTLTGFICGLIILVRPTNALIFSTFLFMDINKKEEIILRFKNLLHPSTLLPISLTFLFTLIPQIVYWKHTYGSFLFYSYGNENFNWLDPKPFLSWFSPKNGLFLYTPFFLMLVFSCFVMKKYQRNNFYFFIFFFAVLSYIISSWYDWAFGCALGGRSYVEYLAMFCIPLGYLFQEVFKKTGLVRTIFFVVLTIFILYNLKLTYSYDGCFPGIGNWDWQAYKNLLFSSTK